jgi:alcohol dehydrogenase
MGNVSSTLEKKGINLPGFFAVQCASGSAAHLTKYSNITDPETSQKKLIIDQAVVPPRSLFDYGITCSASRNLTLDGAFDGLAHLLEVYYGAKDDIINQVEELVKSGVSLIISSAEKAVESPDDTETREALGLGTDLGGYAIMTGGTNGPHLNSFSFVDVLSHGRACALMIPYYTVFFAPAIERQLRILADMYKQYGFLKQNVGGLSAEELGIAVAESMLCLSRSLGFPATLGEVDGFTDAHAARALEAAKNPQLASKLQQMPSPMTAEQVDEYMGSVIEAARTGDLSVVKHM